MTRRLTAIILTGLLAVAAACNVNKPATSGLAGVTVHGRVATPGGTPVAGVAIALGWQPTALCGAPFATTDSGPRTDANGRYGILVVDTVQPPEVCVKVVATPPANLSFAAESIVVFNVPMSHNLWDDSVRIDVVVPPK